MEYSILIMGSMYSGKSEELKRIIKRSKIVGKKCQIFKPSVDDRYSDTQILTHENAMIIDNINDNNIKDLVADIMGLSATSVSTSSQILELINDDTEVVGIDEVQFFDNNIINVIEELNRKNIRVVMSGLDMYASGEPFNITSQLACKCKYVEKLHAVCMDCKGEAMYSFNILNDNSKSVVDIGSKGKYIALCENCRDKRENKL